MRHACQRATISLTSFSLDNQGGTELFKDIFIVHRRSILHDIKQGKLIINYGKINSSIQNSL
jgi:hypothetical protein